MSTLNITKVMSGKMKGFWSVNSSPLNNEYCQKMAKTEAVCSKCYSQRLEKFYGSTKGAGTPEGMVRSWVENGEYLSTHQLTEEEVPFFPRRTKPIRFHAHGELINLMHYLNMVAIAKKNPHIIFALWSKRVDILRGNLVKLDNLIHIYSNPKINAPKVRKPAGFDKIFSVFTKEYVKENGIEINCGSKNCSTCLSCYTHNDITHVNELVK